MIIRNCNINDVEQICKLWNEEVASQGYFKPLDVEDFMNRFVNNVDFDFDGVFGAFDDNKTQIISNEIKVGDKVCIGTIGGGGKSKKPTGMRPPRM